MSFPCSFLTLSTLGYKLIGKSYINRFFNSSAYYSIKEKYIIKKLTREFQKTMQPIGDHNLLSPPDSIRGLKVLDKSLFNKQIKVCAVYFSNVIISDVMPHLKKYLLKLENLRPLQTESNDSKTVKYILLNPIYVQSWSDISENDRKALIQLGVDKEQFKIIDFTIKYENWKADELLKYILPEDKESVAGFSKIGHIVHLNLRDHVMDYKEIIGHILLDKTVGCRTVVNKLDKIDNTYRNFQMEILCGDKDMHVTVKENRCTFEFDFSTVYWNPRLSTEHERIVNLLKPGDVLYDVFAGVGPFSIPVAKKKCKVLANDLNPESFKWLNHNAKINKINNDFLKTFNKDGHDFITNDVKNDLLIRFKKSDYNNIYITMNLPALAPEFLPAFKNLLTNSELDNIEIKKYPKVIVYCFAKGEDPNKIARELIESNLKCSLPENVEIFNVRKVSSFKEMMRVSFELSREFLFGNSCKKRGIQEDDESSDFKKCYAMGKNKGKQKVKNVFKVAGAKSLKLKTKAKMVNTQLKKINNVTKEKVQNSDKQLAQLEDAVRQTTKVVKKEERTLGIKKDLENSQKIETEVQNIINKNVTELKSLNM